MCLRALHLHEYSIAGVIFASVAYSAFATSSNVLWEMWEIELLYAFKDGTHPVFSVDGVFAV